MKIDLHTHTNNSNDALHDIHLMIKYAKKVGLQAIAITDHNKLLTEKKARDLTKQYSILVIPGIELGKMGFLNHIIALNIKKIPTQTDVNEILQFINDEGGFSIAPHPFSRIGYHNYQDYKFNAVEAKNGINWICNLRYKPQHKLPEVGNSDAHAAYMLGYTWTEIEHADTIERLLETLRNRKCKPAGTTIPNHLIARLTVTLGARIIMKKYRQIPKVGFSYEDTFYFNYTGIWARG
ncbi:MAG TPA: PHP domain-containing protein [Candidatus Thermoplasmatota archaeon]|nr:PHP domain-containing protein [Candidatus Thermoplasmatota archaeon]